MKFEVLNIKNLDGSKISIIRMIDSDGLISYVPHDEANTDYQAYLAWLEEQEKSK